MKFLHPAGSSHFWKEEGMMVRFISILAAKSVISDFYRIKWYALNGISQRASVAGRLTGIKNAKIKKEITLKNSRKMLLIFNVMIKGSSWLVLLDMDWFIKIHYPELITVFVDILKWLIFSSVHTFQQVRQLVTFPSGVEPRSAFHRPANIKPAQRRMVPNAEARLPGSGYHKCACFFKTIPFPGKFDFCVALYCLVLSVTVRIFNTFCSRRRGKCPHIRPATIVTQVALPGWASVVGSHRSPYACVPVAAILRFHSYEYRRYDTRHYHQSNINFLHLFIIYKSVLTKGNRTSIICCEFLTMPVCIKKKILLGHVFHY